MAITFRKYHVQVPHRPATYHSAFGAAFALERYGITEKEFNRILNLPVGDTYTVKHKGALVFAVRRVS